MNAWSRSDPAPSMTFGKYATFLDKRDYCVFATAASMNGYTSSTASMNLESGLKVSLPAQAPKGFFVDLEVSAAAPPYLAAAGFADLLRPVPWHRIDWWMSHRMLGTDYWTSPYLIQDEDERILNGRAGLLPKGDVEAIASLYRVLTLCGLGISFTGVSNHGSMAEHQISHYIDCFAGDRHPGTLHGQQVGVASLTMARLQHHFLKSDTPPKVSATRIDSADMARRMGADIAAECEAEWRKKAFTDETADAFKRPYGRNLALASRRAAGLYDSGGRIACHADSGGCAKDRRGTQPVSGFLPGSRASQSRDTQPVFLCRYCG